MVGVGSILGVLGMRCALDVSNDDDLVHASKANVDVERWASTLQI